MPTCLLKRVLPFTLTFIIGAALGGFFNPFGAWRISRRVVLRTELMRDYDFGEGHGCKSGRSKRREPGAESKPLVILFKPDARWPRELRGMSKEDFLPISVRVTFGADGKVQEVHPLDDLLCCKLDVPKVIVWYAAAAAARQIQFEPETINGLPVSVTKDVEIRFMRD